ncbi:unnamed protein product [Caenorhabditis angaria]|uniref:ANK_REP_REGION domain-containing protein n=1 Tax=Caenorhabditis angaria TaxID=860376 RepID=A0A9P1IWL3_9PELO|nr:unnamed protein product [Caenorhabditis angaria]
MLHRAFDEQQLDFLHLCSLGDEQRVQSALLSGRVDINYRHKQNGWSALHWAACRAHKNVCLVLIEAGYPLNCVDNTGRTPYDVCPEDKSDIRDILQSTEQGEEEQEQEDMVQSTARRRASEAPQHTPGFVPNYVRNPPFPYTHKTSFDNSYSSPPMTPGSPNSNTTTYSYGRRDSFNKTRFLLVRTSVEKGKETYKRVTLPGGSDIERLKSTIEKACKGKAVDMIFTLPENDLVETEEQIHAFKDCQKIDVIFKDENREQTPAVTSDRMSKDDVVEKDYSTAVQEKDEVEVPKSYEENENIEIDVESSNNSEESTEEITKVEEEPKLIPLATRQSLDSDPGDFVKVESGEEEKLGETSPAVAGIAAAIPIINAQVEEEAKHQPPPQPEDLPSFTVPSSKATVVEESNQVPEDRKSSDIATWIHQNPDIVRNVATAAAVAGVAGLGYYVYVKK